MSVRQLDTITIVARSEDNARKVIELVAAQYPDVTFKIATDIKNEVNKADIIVCATGSPTPLFEGSWLTTGTHIDCLGNHNIDRRECDSATMIQAKVYVDSLANNLAEAGELLIPISEGVFSKIQLLENWLIFAEPRHLGDKTMMKSPCLSQLVQQ